MLHDIEDLVGGTILATDGKIGEIRSFYFDDHEWIVRYLLVATSPWFNSRDVLVALECFQDVDWQARTCAVQLTREKIKNAPGIDASRPVERSREDEIVRYYGWQQYWNVRTLERRPMAGTDAGRQVAVAEPAKESLLRNTREVFGYTIRATDGEIGVIDSFIVDDACWQIRYAIVDTGNWIPGKRVLVSPEWITGISWEDADIDIRLTKGRIAQAPEFDPRRPITREYEDALCRYYGMSKYWER